MDRTLLNKRTKFGAKIFRRYQVINHILRVGSFLVAPSTVVTPTTTLSTTTIKSYSADNTSSAHPGKGEYRMFA